MHHQRDRRTRRKLLARRNRHGPSHASRLLQSRHPHPNSALGSDQSFGFEHYRSASPALTVCAPVVCSTIYPSPKGNKINLAQFFLTTGLLSALLAVPATAALPSSNSARAALGSTPFAHQNYGKNVVSGRAELASEGGENAAQTKVVVKLTGLRPGAAHVGHIHGGTCAALAPGAIFHNLEPVVANSSGEGKSETEIPQGMQGLADCSWWVAFHEGAANAALQTPAIAVGPVITRSREPWKKD